MVIVAGKFVVVSGWFVAQTLDDGIFLLQFLHGPVRLLGRDELIESAPILVETAFFPPPIDLGSPSLLANVPQIDETPRSQVRTMQLTISVRGRQR